MTTLAAYSRLAADAVVAPRSDDDYQLILRLTGIIIIVFADTAPAIRPILYVLCGGIVLLPTWTYSRSAWWAVAMTLVLGNMKRWEIIDNHDYLLVYVVLMGATSIGVRDARSYCRTASRWMIVVMFGLAVLWKIIAAEYLNGSFFYFTFLTDSRVQDVAATIAGVATAHIRDVSSEMIRGLSANVGGDLATTVPLLERLTVTSLVLSWVTLGLEATIACTRLTRWSPVRRCRHIPLGLFIATTYWLLPVPGFGSALAMLGFAECEENEGGWATMYLFLLAAIQFTAWPWRTYLHLVP